MHRQTDIKFKNSLFLLLTQLSYKQNSFKHLHWPFDFTFYSSTQWTY